MNIGVETSALTPEPTGTGRYVQCLLEQLGQLPHAVQRFTPFTDAAGLHVRNHYGSYRRHWFRTFELAKRMRAAQVDCAIFPNYLMPPRFDRPSAIVIHDLSFLSHPRFYSRRFVWYYTSQLQLALRQKPIVITLSEYSRHQIRQFLNLPAEAIHLLQPYSPLGSQPSQNLRGPHDDRPYFLFVGHIEPRKNIAFLLRGFLEWLRRRGDDYELRLVGRVWARTREMRRQIEPFVGDPRIRFLGHVDDETLHRLYHNASGLVHTSWVEGFGLPILEAMHFGLPILCSRGTAMEEVVGPGGILVDPGDLADLVRGLDRLAEVGRDSGRIAYDISFTPERMRRQLNNIVDRMMPRADVHGGTSWRAGQPVEAVEKTLLYAGLFDAGVSASQLHRCIQDLRLSEGQLKAVLESLHKDGGVLIRDEVIRLNFEIPSLKFARRGHGMSSRLKGMLMALLRHLPMVSAIALSGGAAHKNDGLEDDLDVFIITRKHAVYIVYALLHAVSLAFGLRRTLCPNYLIDESALEIRHQQDLYTAHQIVSLLPVQGFSVFDRFLAANRWVHEFFPNVPIPPANEVSPGIAAFWKPLNYSLYALYRWVWRKRVRHAQEGALRLTPHVMKLHTRDHRPRVMRAFHDAWLAYRHCQALARKEIA